MPAAKRVTILAATAALATMGLAACGSSQSSAGGSTPASPAGTSPAARPALSGTPAPSGASPITVGFANMNSGPVSFPGAQQGAQIAEDYINKELGGIHGHPLHLVFCDLQGTVQATQACGQQFAGNASMPFALTSLNVNGNAGLNAPMTAAGKPVLGAVGITATDLATPGAYWAYAGNPAVYGAEAQVDKQAAATQGVKNVSIIYDSGDQSTEVGVAQVKKTVTAAGLKATATPVSPSAADYLAPVTASGVTPDSVLELNIINTAGCVGIGKDLVKLGIKPKMVLASASCVTPQLLAANPGVFDNWYFLSAVEDAFTDIPKNPASVQQYLTSWKQFGSGGAAVPATGNLGYGVVMTAYEILSHAKYSKLTPSVVKQAILSYKGPVPLSAGKLSCPGAAPNPGMCNSAAVFYQDQNGTLVVSQPGKS